jgi:ABC-2 type transport system ATP-binding protein
MSVLHAQTDRIVETARVEMARPILVVDGMSKSFGPVVAVRELSFSARSGEIIGLLGPNGAGKTTAIRVLSTILPPTKGSFSLDGIPHTKSNEIRRRIGVLPESAGYPLSWSGAEFLRYYAKLYGYSAQRSRDVAASLLADVGLAARAGSLISTYSRGMRQRLGVARALVNDPQLIFLDEPTLGLDPAGQRQMLELIRDLARQRGATVVLTTHFLDEVEEVCSRVLILNYGAVIAEGSVADVMRQAAPATSRFRVPPEMQDAAMSALRRTEGITSVSAVEHEQGWLIVRFEPGWLDGHREGGMNSAISALTAAEIPVLSFEREGGRLSDAFFALTEEDQS